jgi:redox-sensitive bicupin YhaK (pirin superfamily)
MTEATAPKSLQQIHTATGRHWVGDGFPVSTVFAYTDLGQDLNPFIMLDYAAPYVFEPTERRRGVGEHPHRGFETVTVVYDGHLEHRDSSGGGGTIGPGDVQWMTAGAGIVHEEMHTDAFARAGGVMRMAQLWVNLPANLKRTPPGYQTILASTIPTATIAGGALRVIAGEYAGVRGPAKTFTPMNVCDVRLDAGADMALELPAGWLAALFVMEGQVEISDGRALAAGQLGIFSRDGSRIALRAGGPVQALLLAAEPIDEPIVGYGPFVMNTREEIVEAFRDYEAGRMGHLA